MTASLNHRQYRGSKPRGPQRHRWEPKEQPYCSYSTIALFFGLATALALLMAHAVRGGPSWRLLPQPKTYKLRGRFGIEMEEFASQELIADAIVVGSGLAGLTTALTLLDRGGTVIIIEKEPILGGNSNKASSGMNACCIAEDGNNDTVARFFDDTVQSAGEVADLELIHTLVNKSAAALAWFRVRVGVDLPVLVKLGGHSRKRTHRPRTGFVGAEIINAMETAIRSYEARDKVVILVDTRVSQILHDRHGQVMGVISESLLGKYRRLRTDHVVLATGGFASDRSHGSYLERYRPELLAMAATAGSFSTGDGITLTEPLGAATRDLEKIQLHPTGFVDPADPGSPNKALAAELLRGVGGILINREGRRFCNELGTRAYVTDKMLEHHSGYVQTRKWDFEAPIPTFYLLLSASAGNEARAHLDLYLHKGLMTKVDGVEALAYRLGVPEATLYATIREYISAAAIGVDEFGKTEFRGIPMEDLSSEVFYVGTVTPVLHYCMGGIKIDTEGNVLREDGAAIPGLHATGEVTGGVHGNNRLGGNSLLECAVFGSIVGREIPIQRSSSNPDLPARPKQDQHRSSEVLRFISLEELSQHDMRRDCWVAIHGKVYDLTHFADRHPGGASSILSLAGTDGTGVFSSMHSTNILSRVEEHLVGILDAKGEKEQSPKVEAPLLVTAEELSRHNSPEDCWVALFGTVYDLTEFSKHHPGGSYIIQKLAGKDGTANYGAFHPQSKLETIQAAVVGKLFVDKTLAVES